MHSIASIEDDSWLLTSNYTHSTHEVAVDLDINIVPEFPTWTSILLTCMPSERISYGSSRLLRDTTRKATVVTAIKRAIKISGRRSNRRM
jgi:hypothetical protein